MNARRSAVTQASAIHAAAVPFLEDLYRRYQLDRSSVDASWSQVFELVDELVGSGSSELAQADWILEKLRREGHRIASTNPLGTDAPARPHQASSGVLPPAALASAGDAVRSAWCGALGVEFAHIDDEATVSWVLEAVESIPSADLPALQVAHNAIVRADLFERFLGRKFPGKKRFGAEGAESAVPLLDRLLRNAAADGVREVVIGTMHRGRLNLLANVLGKPLDELLAQFKGAHPSGGGSQRSADVPYHLGFSAVMPETGLAVTVLPNPSHLEAVNAVVLGWVRARQDLLPPAARGQVLGIILHTDAAVVGQGVVAETLQLGLPEGFNTLGTIHVVINNQLGFTTEPLEARSSAYCTGPWKAVDSLVLHANGDDVPAVLRAADLATGFRAAHGRDCVIDLVCYRRNGHNEMDEPRFTQPRLYQSLETKPAVRQLFERQLMDAGLLEAVHVDAIASAYQAQLDRAYASMAEWRPSSPDPHGPGPAACEKVPPIVTADLMVLMDHIATVPGPVAVESKIERLVRQRSETDKGIVWAVGEALAFASLLSEGIAVRLTGQDVVRGAFSHRHFSLTDVANGERHVSLQHLAPGQAPFSVFNSPLSEYAVLGFEYGYSLGHPRALTLWEAQFGDFANGAQIMIDQFIASGEEKWRQRSSLVMLLPHGLEGQGPEHSSARIERFLQLAAQDNLRIAIPTTPANYFHLLRSQAHRPAPKPLVIFSPKTLLRLPAAVSTLEDFGPGAGFLPLHVSLLELDAVGAGKPAVNRVLLCCGKIAYELERERERLGQHKVAIVRLEQLYPLPQAELAALVRRWPDAPWLWVQEEPANMGAWSWLDRRLEALAQACGHSQPRVTYCGRPESASPAGSFHEHHAAHQAAIVAAAFNRHIDTEGDAT